MFEEAMNFADENIGRTTGRQICRDVDADQLRSYQHAVEAWEGTHAPALKTWAEIGPAWDEQFTRNLLSDVLNTFPVVHEFLGRQLAAALKEWRSRDSNG
jgi:hypothetical protein